MKLLFKQFKHPKKRTVYAVTKGTYLGELLVFIEEDAEFKFLTLPNMNIRSIPKDKFEFGLKEGIVEVVKRIPSFVYSTCKKQYLKNKNAS